LSRLHIHVEGQTEETFVNKVLAPHLYDRGYTNVSARLVGNARQRDRRGGIRGWNSVRNDILKHLKEDAGCLATTMVDYYGLPRTGPKAWPGREAAGDLPFPRRAATVEDAMLADIRGEFGGEFHPQRFIPYVMMHEFEGLLFSDCARFAEGIGRPELADEFQVKRIEKLVPGYEKPLLGRLAVLEIGLDAIRAECPHFRKWLERLEVWTAARN